MEKLVNKTKTGNKMTKYFTTKNFKSKRVKIRI